MSVREAAMRIYNAGLQAVLPHQLIKNLMYTKGDNLFVQGKRYDLHKNVYVVGFGKAVLGMAKGIEQILKRHIVKGIVSIPHGLQTSLAQSSFAEGPKMLLDKESTISVKEGALYNLPDEDAMRNALLIENLVKDTKEDDLLFILVSGGGSALLPAPINGISLAEKQDVINLLAKSGATIQELNTVRTKLSRLKGGKLGALAGSNHVISLILSDIVGDPAELISSGPTVSNSSTFQDCLKILRKLRLENEIPKNVKEYLSRCANNEIHDDANEQLALRNVDNILIGNNMTAVCACKTAAEDNGFQTLVMTTSLEGEARVAGKCFADIAFAALTRATPNLSSTVLNLNKTSQRDLEALISESNRVCLIAAGETTVSVKGNGRGGRNQELVLAAALHFQERLKSFPQTALSARDNIEICLLSAGTDGQDGPTTAAGAIFMPAMINDAQAQGLCIKEYLDNNGSYDFYSKLNGGENLFITGLTGTNVMDIQILLINKKL